MRTATIDSLQQKSPVETAYSDTSVALPTDSLHVPSKQPSFRVDQILANLPAHATPAQQDSAIQANLPKREKIRSACPDTLYIPGLKGHSPYRKETDLPRVYAQHFFTNNPAYHPEIDGSYLGKTAIPLSYQLRNDDTVTGVLLVCFFLLMHALGSNKNFFRHELKNFFFESHRNNNRFVEKTGQEKRLNLFIVLQTSLALGLLFFDYSQEKYDLFMGQLSPHVLLGLYIIVCLAYFGIKKILYSFVNWVFFEKGSCRSWEDATTVLQTLEGLLLFPLVLVTVYFDLQIAHVVRTFIILVGVNKVLTLYKGFSIFFRETRGSLHNFVYFCTLEIVPLLALWKTLVLVTEHLIIKF